MSRKRTILVSVGSLAAGALIATSVTGLALAADGDAATPSSGASAPASPQTQAPGDRRPGGAGLGGRLLGTLRPGLMLHSETVVKAQDGSFVTVGVTAGTVTAVSSSSITVKAEDGYAATYVVTADTKIRVDKAGATPAAKPANPGVIGDVAVGDTVQVLGTFKDGVKTAEGIHTGDLPKLGEGPLGRHLGKALHGQGGQHSDGRAPAPAASTPAA
jgi:hypothetical protein